MSVINSGAALHYSWDNSGTFVFLRWDYVKEGNAGRLVSVFTSLILSAAVWINGARLRHGNLILVLKVQEEHHVIMIWEIEHESMKVWALPFNVTCNLYKFESASGAHAPDTFSFGASANASRFESYLQQCFLFSSHNNFFSTFTFPPKNKNIQKLPVLPVFFIDVLLDDSASNPSSVSSWYSIETLVSWSAILIGDWFLSWHSGKAAAHPVSGPYVPAEEKRQ